MEVEEIEVIGIIIMTILYLVFRKGAGYSRMKSALLGIGIYAIAPAPVTFFILSMLGVGEILPYLALVPEEHVPAIVKQWGEDLNSDQSAYVPTAEPQAPSLEPESSFYETTINPKFGVETSYLDNYGSGADGSSDVSFFDAYEGTLPPEPHSIESYGELGVLGDSTDRVGCDPAYPDDRTCIPPGPPFNQGCGITPERRFAVLPPDPQGLDADKDGIGCEPVS